MLLYTCCCTHVHMCGPVIITIPAPGPTFAMSACIPLCILLAVPPFAFGACWTRTPIPECMRACMEPLPHACMALSDLWCGAKERSHRDAAQHVRRAARGAYHVAKWPFPSRTAGAQCCLKSCSMRCCSMRYILLHAVRSALTLRRQVGHVPAHAWTVA